MLARTDLDYVLEQAGTCWGSLAGERVFLTGGTGFVGKWLIETFLWANDRLKLRASLVALTRDPDRFRASTPHLANHRSITVLRGDARSFEFPAASFPFVIHAATEAAVTPDVAHPTGTFDADIDATRRVLQFAASRGARRFLFTSSGAVYGPQPAELTHIPEEYGGAPSATDPTTAYGQAKRASEFLCTMYARQCGYDAAIARLFAFVGPYLPLDRHYAVGNFVSDALRGGPIRIKGDGTPYRSYLYAADLAVWLWTILVRGDSGRAYNVGSGEAITICELARIVAETIAPDMRIEVARKPAAGSPPQRYVPCVERAGAELGLVARIPIRQGIGRMWEWACNNQPSPEMQLRAAAETDS